MQHKILPAVVLALAAAGSPAGAQPQVTNVLTYQGVLENASGPLNGTYDFLFSLWNQPTFGTQVGGFAPVNGATLVGGRFQGHLNFGSVSYGTNQYWLQVAVRPAGGGPYTTLEPRQQLTAAPYAAGLVLPFSANTPVSIPFSLTADNAFNAMIVSTARLGATSILGAAGTGASSIGVLGVSTEGTGVVGSSNIVGVRGNSFTAARSSYGLFGSGASGSNGVGGMANGDNGVGVLGTSDVGVGVSGQSNFGGYGVLGTVAGNGPPYGAGVRGEARQGFNGGSGVSGFGDGLAGSSEGVLGFGLTGVRGVAFFRGAGLGGFGVVGLAETTEGVGVRATNIGGRALEAFGTSLLNGNVTVVGTVAKNGGAFKIDHPLDPANKFLYHSFVESPDMLNIYNGNAVTDAAGRATITMPDWFTALNRDFRYQLTVIGGGNESSFPQVRILRKLDAKGTFTILSSEPGIEVSWMVTGIRQDAWANANRIPTEVAKSESERGRYLSPEAFGLPTTMGLYPLVRDGTYKRVSEMFERPAPEVQLPPPAAPPVLPAAAASPVSAR